MDTSLSDATTAPVPLPALDLDGVTFRGEACALTFDAKAAPTVGHTTWNQVARTGAYKGHPQGPVEFTAKVFDEIVANFAALQNGEVPGDYEHFSECPPDGAAVHGVPAPFWVTAVEIRGDQLWAAFKWVSPVAVAQVRSGEYKYVSPAINFRSRDRATGLPIGARLTSVALTNHPFLDGMTPITASATAPVTPHVSSDVPAIIEGLREHFLQHLRASFGMPDATVEEIGARIRAAATTSAAGTTPALAAAPAADSLHTPGTAPAATAVTSPPRKPPMDNEMEMAAKPAPQTAPASADAAAPDGMMKYAAAMKRLASLPGMGMDAEAAEDAIVERISGLLQELAAVQEKEKAAQMAQAAQMSARVIAAGLAPDTAKDALAALCFTGRSTFDALYPEARIADAEKAVAAKRFSAQGDTRDAVTVLAQRIAPNGDPPPPAVSPDASDAEKLHARAQVLAREHKVDLFTARGMAEREVLASRPAA